MGTKYSKTATVNLTPGEKRQLVACADREQRSVSNVIRRAVLAYLNGGK